MPVTLNEQERRRREELHAIRKAGIDPYPHGWEVTDEGSNILATFDDNLHQPGENRPPRDRYDVSIAGRVTSLRVMGRAAFFDVQDESGTIQVYVRRDALPEGFYDRVFKRLLDIGDIVGVQGFAFRTRMGEISVHAEELKLLSKSLRPLPIVKETKEGVHHEVTDKEFRYRRRYVDLIVNPDVREVFRKRARLISTMRRFLDDRGYVEVETPVLQPVYGGASARPFMTHHNTLDMTLFLRIADELYLKRLLVGGFTGVYEISKDFRNEGLSRFHNPEFTMMELYVAYKDYWWMMDLVEEMIETIAVALHGRPHVRIGGHGISFERPWKRQPLFEAIEQYAGVSVADKSRGELAAIVKELGVDVDDSMGRGKLIDELFSEKVEPHLVQPTFIIDYPLELSPLAKRHREKEGLVERFELICHAKEICNAFSELNDPLDQRSRFEDQARLRTQGDEEAMQVDEDYLRAMEYGMPPAAGLGVGIDRLTMLMTGQESIRDVILFPLLRPESSGQEGPASKEGGTS